MLTIAVQVGPTCRKDMRLALENQKLPGPRGTGDTRGFSPQSRAARASLLLQSP